MNPVGPPAAAPRQPSPAGRFLAPTAGPAPGASQEVIRPQLPAIPAVVPIVVIAGWVIRSWSSAETRASLPRLWQVVEPALPRLLDCLEVPPKAHLRTQLVRGGRERPGLAVAVLLAVVAKSNPRASGPLMRTAAARHGILSLMFHDVTAKRPRPRLSLVRNPRLRRAMAAHAGLPATEDRFAEIWDLCWDLVASALVPALTAPGAWLEACVSGDWTSPFRRALARELEADFEPNESAVPDDGLERIGAARPLLAGPASPDVRLRAERAVRLLDPKDEAICQLMADTGCTRAEAARKLKIPPGTARVRHHRALKRLTDSAL